MRAPHYIESFSFKSEIACVISCAVRCLQKHPLAFVQRISSSVFVVLRMSVQARSVVLREAATGGVDSSTLVTGHEPDVAIVRNDPSVVDFFAQGDGLQRLLGEVMRNVTWDACSKYVGGDGVSEDQYQVRLPQNARAALH